MTELSIVVLGNAGCGKSSTSNTLLGKEKFEVSSSMLDSTRLPTLHTGQYRGNTLRVYDMPDACDARYDSISKCKQICFQHINQVMEASEGADVFLYVLKYFNRWSHSDTQTVELMRKIFGNKFFSEHCIIVVTHWDNAIKDGVESFDQWLQIQHERFRSLVAECEKRYVVLDNKANDVGARQTYRESLLERVIAKQKRKDKYTLADFKRNSREHAKLQYWNLSCTIL